MKGVGVLSVCEDRSHIAADKMIRKTPIPPPHIYKYSAKP